MAASERRIRDETQSAQSRVKTAAGARQRWQQVVTLAAVVAASLAVFGVSPAHAAYQSYSGIVGQYSWGTQNEETHFVHCSYDVNLLPNGGGYLTFDGRTNCTSDGIGTVGRTTLRRGLSYYDPVVKTGNEINRTTCCASSSGAYYSPPDPQTSVYHTRFDVELTLPDTPASKWLTWPDHCVPYGRTIYCNVSTPPISRHGNTWAAVDDVVANPTAVPGLVDTPVDDTVGSTTGVEPDADGEILISPDNHVVTGTGGQERSHRSVFCTVTFRRRAGLHPDRAGIWLYNWGGRIKCNLAIAMYGQALLMTPSRTRIVDYGNNLRTPSSNSYSGEKFSDDEPRSYVIQFGFTLHAFGPWQTAPARTQDVAYRKCTGLETTTISCTYRTYVFRP